MLRRPVHDFIGFIQNLPLTGRVVVQAVRSATHPKPTKRVSNFAQTCMAAFVSQLRTILEYAVEARFGSRAVTGSITAV